MIKEKTQTTRKKTSQENGEEYFDDIQEKKSSRFSKKGKTRLILSALLALVIVLGAWFVFQHVASDEYKQKAAQKEVVELIAKVRTKMILPTNEEPAIFDITDPAQLSAQQAFFSDAIQGDKLLVYSKTAKAIIYSPSRKLIVNVGPVTFDQDTAGTKVIESTPTPSAEREE